METLGSLYHFVTYDDETFSQTQSQRSSLPKLSTICPTPMMLSVLMLASGAITQTVAQVALKSSPLSNPWGVLSANATGEMSDLVIQIMDDDNAAISGTITQIEEEDRTEFNVLVRQEDELETRIMSVAPDVTVIPSPAVTGNICIDCLRFGSEGNRVVALQSQLRALGFFDEELTGYFGPITEDALLRFQQANNLLADGIAGPQTFNLLNQQLSATTLVTTAPQSMTVPAVVVEEVQTVMPRVVVEDVSNVAPMVIIDESPTPVPTVISTVAPTVVPTVAPTVVSAVTPTVVPTAVPTVVSTVSPTVVPAAVPAVVIDERPTIVVDERPTIVVREPEPIAIPILFPEIGGNVGAELYIGESGQAVAQLQTALERAGIYKGPLTGYYGSGTANAVASFQRSQGIPPTGVAGIKTLEKLNEVINE